MNIKNIFSSAVFSVLCSAVFFLCLVSLPERSFSATIENHTLEITDLYLRSYNSLSKTLNAETKTVADSTYETVATSLGISTAQLDSVFVEENAGIVDSLCPDIENILTRQIECQNRIVSRINREYERQQFQKELQTYALASQAFTNGTRQDTGGGFDIVVDLNIIDLLFFGDKMNVPATGSPFLPSDLSYTSPDIIELGSGEGEGVTIIPDTEIEITPEDESEDSEDETEAETETGDDSEESEEEEEEDEGFCTDPNALFLSTSVTTTILDSNPNTPDEETHDSSGSDSSSALGTYTQIQLGNIINDQIKYTGGQYPDLSSLGGSGCGAGEQSLFQGRVCIPEFCTELICIKINIKNGRRDDTLRDLDCIECHIDRANEALSPFLGTLGQNTPVSNPMEGYFLSSFANLFKNVTSTISLHPKPLPFLVYDDTLAQHKEKQEAIANPAPASSEETEETQTIEPSVQEKNAELYNAMLMSECQEMATLFRPGEGTLDSQVQFCNNISPQSIAQATQTLQSFQPKGEYIVEREEISTQRSVMFHTVVQPFFSQLSSNMVTINSHLEEINLEDIRAVALSCKVKQ